MILHSRDFIERRRFYNRNATLNPCGSYIILSDPDTFINIYLTVELSACLHFSQGLPPADFQSICKYRYEKNTPTPL